jgi:hypothetical protein
VLAGTEWAGLHPHAFRHLVATRLDEAGLSARQTADYLGHPHQHDPGGLHGSDIVGQGTSAALIEIEPTDPNDSDG